MSTALPKISQAGKPVGVAGQSRDDLDLYTVPGTEIELTDVGTGALTWQWILLDQPPGSAVTFSNPTAQTTLLLNLIIAGSYLIRLVVDGGGLPSQVFQFVVAVQIQMPSWVTPSLNRPMRIPAKGETTEFNVESSPGAGLNTRGWAQEMDHILRSVATFGFGVRGATKGVAVSTEPNYTLDLIGPVNPALLYFQNDTNAHLQPRVGGIAEVVVTAAHHQSNLHSSGILLTEKATNNYALACTVTTATNPMTLGFQSLAVGDANAQVVVEGAVFNATAVPDPITYALPATTGKALKLIHLAVNTSAPYVTSTDIAAVVGAAALSLVVMNMHPDFPDKDVVIACDGNVLTLDGGPCSVFNNGSGVRLYDPAGVYWIDLLCYGVPAVASETWRLTGSLRHDRGVCPLAVAAYWLNGAVSTWGFDLNGDQRVYDARRIGSIGAGELQDSAMQVVDRIAGDMRWNAGVIFTHEETTFSSGNEKHVDAFALVPDTSGAPVQDAVAVRGGSYWVNGRRQTIAEKTLMSSIGVPGTAMCIAIKVTAYSASVVAFSVASGNPIDAIKQCTNFNDLAMQAAGGEAYVPLYFGKFNGAGTALIADGRIDLRRDVAHHGEWTVACRDFSELANFETVEGHGRIGLQTNAWRSDSRVVAEFSSIASALAWHGALTGSDNLTPVSIGSHTCNKPLTLRVLGDTYETFPIHLRNNVTIRGEGRPFVYVAPSRWWLNYGFAGYAWSYFSIGDPHSTNRPVFGVSLRDIALVATDYSGVTHGANSVLSLWATAAANGSASWEMLGTTQEVLIDNVGFDSLGNPAALAYTDDFSAMRIQSVATGVFHRVRVSNCANLLLARYVTDADKRAFNGGVHIATGGVMQKDISITSCKFSVNTFGVKTASAYLDQLRITDCDFEITHADTVLAVQYAYGVCIGAGFVTDTEITHNTFSLATLSGIVSRSIFIGSVLTNSKIVGNTIIANGGDDQLSAAIVIAAAVASSVYNVDIKDNQVHTQQHGIMVVTTGAANISLLNITGNTIINDNVSVALTGEGVGLQSAAACQNVRVENNTMSLFDGNIIVSAVTGSDISIVNNHCVARPAYSGSCGVHLVASTALTNVLIKENSFHAVRIGIWVPLPIAGSTALLIEGNNISGQITNNATGFACRGIYVTTDLAAANANNNVVIRNNVVRNVYGCSSTDVTLSSGGIVVYNEGEFILSGVQINDNDVMLHDEQTAMLNADYPGQSGIALIGTMANVEVNRNKIVNRAVRISSLIKHGGILVQCAIDTDANRSHHIQANDNTITWVDASYVDGANATAACILFDMPTSIRRIQVNRNVLTMQCVLDVGSGIEGSMHGILLGAVGVRQAYIEVSENRIYSIQCAASIAEPVGTCGCAIWIRGGDITMAQVSDNHCSGYFRVGYYTTTEELKWGAISVNVDDASGSVSNTSVDRNSIIILEADASYNGSQNLANGIRVGALTNCGGQGKNCSVRGNNITAWLNASNAVAMLSAAISVNATPEGISMNVSDNIVTRYAMTVDVIDGISNCGWGNSLFANNVVSHDTVGVELHDRAFAGATASNIWANNIAGSVAANGVITLVSPPYKAHPVAVTNWNGLAFS